MSTILVADSSVLINLLHVERLETFASLPMHRWVVPEEVCAEIIVLEQRRELERLVGAGILERLVLDDIASITRELTHTRESWHPRCP
jgi:predicted nucleic acid-binding protein